MLRLDPKVLVGYLLVHDNSAKVSKQQNKVK